MNFSKPRRLGGLPLDGRFKEVRFRSVAFSPDGQRILLSVRSSLRSDIVQMDCNGRNFRFLASAGRTPRAYPRDDDYWDLQMTPDGAHLLYGLCEDDEEIKTLCLLDLGTGEQKRLTDARAMQAINPRLSPDGQSVVFESWTAGTPPQLCRIALAGHDAASLSLPNGTHPAYSPDGQQIAFLSSDYDGKTDDPLQVCVMRSDGTEVQQLTNLPDYCGEPFWHPDGQQIAFTTRAELPAGIERSLWKYRTNLCLINTDGSHLRHLEESSSVNRIGGFGPDGRWLIYSTSGDERFPEGKRNWDIRVLDTETGAVHTVTDNDVYDIDPLFSPDGNSILFISERDGYCGLHQMDIL